MEVNKDPATAVNDYLDMQKKSWTWAKMTQGEQEKFIELLEHPCSSTVIKGTYKQRYEACQALYHAYLAGLGYTSNWRDGVDTKTSFTVYGVKSDGAEVKLEGLDQANLVYWVEVLAKEGYNVQFQRIDTQVGQITKC